MQCLSAAHVAELLGVTPQTVSRLARSSAIACSLVGGRRVFEYSDVTEYMKENNLCPAPKDHRRLDESDEEITAISFFSGALGLDLGMEHAGIKSYLLCENDTKCRMTIESNRPGAGLLGDINKVTASDVYEFACIDPKRGVDVMFGGPPCQAFSTAGARRAFDDARGNVFLQYLRLAEEIRPKYLVIENVRGLLSTAYPLNKGGEAVHGGAMSTILRRLRVMEYGVTFNLYNAANFGAPQMRDRVVLIAKRDGGKVPWLTPTHCNDPSWGLPSWKTFGDAISDLNGDMHFIQFPEKRLKYFRLLREGECWKNLPDNLQEEAMGKAYRLSGGKTGFYRRLHRDRPCPTLVTSPTMPATDLCHPVEDRPLSIEEYRAVQGFPDDWVIRGDIHDAYRQVGNAVPVALGEAIGRTILADMRGKPLSPGFDYATFPFSRYRNSNDVTWKAK